LKDVNARQLLAKVMGWQSPDQYQRIVPDLLLLAEHKYDDYQRFAAGRRFIENLAVWLAQFQPDHRDTALQFVRERLIFISEAELSHLVQIAYPDVVNAERMKLVAEEQGIPSFRVAAIAAHARFMELGLKSLYLGLSDGARTNELRRASRGEISNEQIWQAYELSDEKADDMVTELSEALKTHGFGASKPQFNLIWLLDDFAGSGSSYIRYDAKSGRYKGKIRKIYERLAKGDLIDTAHYEVFLLLYVATHQAFNHIEYWSQRFTSANGYKPLQLRVLHLLEGDCAVTRVTDPAFAALIEHQEYYDHAFFDKHLMVGGTKDARWGFAACALPVVLAHNTPNNSVYMLWGP
jgi:hypothetical protein